jgi:Type I phosphodiesterase / nucleotide pyrophosphatase
VVDELVLPDYGGACIANIIPALLGPPDETPAWMPAGVAGASQVVLFVVDGLGWEQLQARLRLAPTLASMVGGSVTTVAPSTTSTALTSLTTGLPPGEHGVVGYRIAAQGEVLNVLRWSTVAGDARLTIPPSKLQPSAPFLGERPAVVTRAEYRRSGFTGAHLDPARFWGYRTMATMVTEVGRLVRAGEPFVYSYYDGLDKVAHEYGLGEHYDAELSWIDHLVERLLTDLPRGAALVVTADHGQVEVGDHVVELAGDVLAQTSMQSGEGRFRWLHARAGRARALWEAARACHSDDAWVRTRDEVVQERWLAPTSRSTTRWTPARTSWWAGMGR